MFENFARWRSRFLGHPSNRAVIDRLHGEIVAAARNPLLFTVYEIEDTFEGRFESVVLHATLVLRRLRALPAPAPDIAQDLADALFRHFEVALREMGSGDSALSKQMKGLAEAFLGRGLAYDEALRGGTTGMAVALKRNVYAGQKDGERLAAYVLATETALAAAPVEAFTKGPVPFPSPVPISMEMIP
jgi:cytochrome b pre-mRNA-processing protein 3